MKTLFIGGVKSGKSRLAETYILKNIIGDGVKPYYLATTEFFDAEMCERIQVNQHRREDQFITLDEPLNLLSTLENCDHPVLVESVSVWLNNMLYHQFSEADILHELEVALALPREMVLVHNEVGLGVTPDNEMARQFVDLSGKAAQLMTQRCDKVFYCIAGLTLTLK
jgi:adenosylcobinamide kinase/adenosylcobinamide-phosphate guanylyltransferase